MQNITDGKIFFKKSEVSLNGLDYANTVGNNDFFKIFKRECFENLVVCNKCKGNIRIGSSKLGMRFVAHKGEKDSTFKGCDNFQYATKSVRLTRQAIYFGEGTLHEELKNELLNLLKKENKLFNMTGESFVYNETEKYDNGARKRRKPDLSGNINGQVIAIELQLSYQLDIDYFAREVFYEAINGFLLWFLYDVKRSDFTDSQKVIFYNSGENAYVITDETRAKSKEEGKLFFWCYYSSFENGRVVNRQSIISFDDLIFDFKRSKVYYVDVEIERLKYSSLKLQETLLKDLEGKDKTMKFSEITIHSINSLCDDKIDSSAYYADFVTLLWTIFSIKSGDVIGYNFKNLIGLLNLRFEYSKEYGDITIRALDIYNRLSELKEHKKFSSLEKKLNNYKSEIIEQNRAFDKIICKIFPELSI